MAKKKKPAKPIEVPVLPDKPEINPEEEIKQRKNILEEDLDFINDPEEVFITPPYEEPAEGEGP